MTGPALDIVIGDRRHVLTLQFDGEQIAAVRVVANPDKLSALGQRHDRRTTVVFEDD